MTYITVKVRPETFHQAQLEDLVKILITASASFFYIPNEDVICEISEFSSLHQSKVDILIRGETSIWKKDKIDSWAKQLLQACQDFVIQAFPKNTQLKIGVKTYSIDCFWVDN